MNCTSPVLINKNLDIVKFPDGLLVPCGKCLLCRISKRREWTLRMLHEVAYNDWNMFITLTYSDEKLPKNMSLKKIDLINFFKRLRKLTGSKFKYFGIGEYGSETDRPHYHAVIFGLQINNENKKNIMDCWTYCDWNVNSIRKNSFGLAEHDSIQYVANYVTKKLSGDMLNEYYIEHGRENVFQISSNGIGLAYCIANADILLRNGYCNVNGKKTSIPRYYLKKLNEKNYSNDYSEEQVKRIIKKITLLEVENEVQLYKMAPEEYNKYLSAIKKSKVQIEQNVKALCDLKVEKF